MSFVDRVLRWRHRFGSKVIRNPRLISAIEELVNNENSITRKRLYTELLRAIFVVPTLELPDAWRGQGLHFADGKTSFQLVVLNRPDGKQVTPVFTDDDALRNWDPNAPSLALRGQDYFLLVVQSPIQEVMINPFDPIRKMIQPGGAITRWELESLAKGDIPSIHPR